MKKHTLLVLVNAPGNSLRISDTWNAPGSGEGLILEHSLHAATQAGFNKIVFVVDRLIRQEFENIITARLDLTVDLQFVDKDVNDLPTLPDPGLDFLSSWGEAQEVLRARKYINEPFLVINSNNYYGKPEFTSALEFIGSETREFCIFCYPLSNTLSNFGGVDRKICFTEGRMDTFSESMVIRDIRKDYKGRLVSQAPMGIIEPLNESLPVSMNMFGLDPRFFEIAENALRRFITNYQTEQNSELSILQILQDKKTEPRVNSIVRTLNTHWVGLNYKADRILARYRLEEKSRLFNAGKKTIPHTSISSHLREHLVLV